MSRYERIATEDAVDDHSSSNRNNSIPNSPPPSFRSYPSSRRPSREEVRRSEEDRDLDDAFDAPSDDEEEHSLQDRRRLLQENNTPSPTHSETPEDADVTPRPGLQERTTTALPVFAPSSSQGRPMGNSQTNDGVFANINAKPRAGEDAEEKPPTYEQAAADATPPYWETTVLNPYHITGDPNDVFVDGLLVGSMFSFIWNALISMSFQLIGFLLTYLLHTTHAAKHGSRAGLGITLVQYGFQMRYSSSIAAPDPNAGNSPVDGIPSDPNSHDFNPSEVASATAAASMFSAMTTSDWLSYALMIGGWFILIRAVSDFLRARRQEALIRSSPDRGLGVAVVAENETPETSV